METLRKTSAPAIDELEARLAVQKAKLRDLATMGAIVASILEIDAVLSVTMDMAIRLVDGEVGLIMLEEKGELNSRITWGVDGSFVKSLKYKDGIDPATYCFQNRTSLILSDLGIRLPEGITLDSIIASPIQTQKRCLGVMIVINKSNHTNFSEEDQETLEMLLHFVAVAVENSMLVKDKLKQAKINQEMAIARQVQESILPDDIDKIEGVRIGTAYFPAREVGGDFYDIIRHGEHKFMVIIGDVSSKGVPAALVMSACSGIIKSILSQQPDISVSDLAQTLNNIMSRQIIKEREMFVTLFFSDFDLEAGRVHYCNAGHLPGLFWNNRQQELEELVEGGPILGQFPDTIYKRGSRELGSGDSLFLFTDGLTEAEDASGNLFGRKRVEQVLKSEISGDPDQCCLRVKEYVDRFARGADEETHDDFTLVQVRVD